MKAAAVLFMTVGMSIAGAAAASAHISDLDWLKANRCKGLATTLGGGDTASLDAMIKAEGRSRNEAVIQRASDELNRARKEAAKSDLKDRLTAELNGPCVALMSAGKDAAGGH